MAHPASIKLKAGHPSPKVVACMLGMSKAEYERLDAMMQQALAKRAAKKRSSRG